MKNCSQVELSVSSVECNQHRSIGTYYGSIDILKTGEDLNAVK